MPPRAAGVQAVAAKGWAAPGNNLNAHIPEIVVNPTTGRAVTAPYVVCHRLREIIRADTGFMAQR